MIVTDRVDDAEYHDGTDYACRRPVNQSLAARDRFTGSCHYGLYAYVCWCAQCNPLKSG
jgi:hypothetical protein